jgi:hypothetical protein
MYMLIAVFLFLTPTGEADGTPKLMVHKSTFEQLDKCEAVVPDNKIKVEIGLARMFPDKSIKTVVQCATKEQVEQITAIIAEMDEEAKKQEHNKI